MNYINQKFKEFIVLQLEKVSDLILKMKLS